VGYDSNIYLLVDRSERRATIPTPAPKTSVFSTSTELTTVNNRKSVEGATPDISLVSTSDL